MHVAAGRGLGRVHVAVRVDPDQPDLLILLAVELGHARDRSGRNRVVATEHERDFAGFERFHDQFGALGAGGGDFFQIFRVGGAFLFLFGDGDGDVAAVFDVVADGFEARFEAGDTNGRGAHVDAAARLAEIEWDADDADLLWGDAGERGVAVLGS